jgi:hypothetical protein
VSYLRCFAALICFALCNAAAFGCGPLAANAVFVVEAGTPPPGNDTRMMLFPLGKWNAQSRNVESFHPEMSGPEIDWMPAQLYTDCNYRLYDSRGRFIRSIHVEKWHYSEEDAGAYVMPGISDLPVDGERYIATNVTTVRESLLVPTQLTHRQYLEGAKRAIPEFLESQRARGDGTRRPGPQDFLVSAFRLGERILSWWVEDGSVTLVEFGPTIAVHTFGAATSDSQSVIQYADKAPEFVIDMDGDGESEILFSLAHDGGGGFVILSRRDDRWIASVEARVGGC